ncbi:MAG: hypothetical protein M0040_02720 [Actinomycetota bacterium]|nr:hypothetical protein [Actinomycetota bacterium]
MADGPGTPDDPGTPAPKGGPEAVAGATGGGETDGSATTDSPGSRLRSLRQQATARVASGARVAAGLGKAAEALHLEVVATGLVSQRHLVGHALGMRQDLKAGGLHGPRQSPVVVYLFADALAVRPSDDAPMSTVPLLGLHMVFPPLAVTHWLYKTGRIEHANLDLVEVADTFEAALPSWSVDDFAEADPKLEVHRCDSLDAPVHVYERLGFAHVRVPHPGGGSLHLQSTLPSTPEAFAKLWDLFGKVAWARGVTMEAPHDAVGG